MYGRKVKLRFFFITAIILSLILSVFLILKSLEENVVYFKSPSDIKQTGKIENNKIRIGGMVKENSIKIKSLSDYLCLSALRLSALCVRYASHQTHRWAIFVHCMRDWLNLSKRKTSRDLHARPHFFTGPV